MQKTLKNAHFQSIAIVLLTLVTTWLLMPHCIGLATELLQSLDSQIHELNGQMGQFYAANS